MACGQRPLTSTRFCQNCGVEVALDSATCLKCGVRLARGGEKDWLKAILLSIFLGPLGADRFYLGYLRLGILKLTLGSCAVWGWVNSKRFAGGFVPRLFLLAAGIWYFVDLILIIMNRLPDAQGYRLRRR